MRNVLKYEKRSIYESRSMGTQTEGNASSRPIRAMAISDHFLWCGRIQGLCSASRLGYSFIPDGAVFCRLGRTFDIQARGHAVRNINRTHNTRGVAAVGYSRIDIRYLQVEARD